MFMMQQAVDDGLTAGRILADIPHDVGAIVVYVLVAAFIGFVWYGGRSGRSPAGGNAHDEGSR